MNKIAVGPAARGVIDIEAPVKDNLHKIAKAIGKRSAKSQWSCSTARATAI